MLSQFNYDSLSASLCGITTNAFLLSIPVLQGNTPLNVLSWYAAPIFAKLFKDVALYFFPDKHQEIDYWAANYMMTIAYSYMLDAAATSINSQYPGASLPTRILLSVESYGLLPHALTNFITLSSGKALVPGFLGGIEGSIGKYTIQYTLRDAVLGPLLTKSGFTYSQPLMSFLAKYGTPGAVAYAVHNYYQASQGLIPQESIKEASLGALNSMSYNVCALENSLPILHPLCRMLEKKVPYIIYASAIEINETLSRLHLNQTATEELLLGEAKQELEEELEMDWHTQCSAPNISSQTCENSYLNLAFQSCPAGSLPYLPIKVTY